jgi:single-stranded DNA-binding protein
MLAGDVTFRQYKQQQGRKPTSLNQAMQRISSSAKCLNNRRRPIFGNVCNE